MKKNTESLSRAIAYVKQGFTRQIWQPGQRLPPIAVLARSAQVRTGIMSAAIQQCAREGLLTCVRNRGIFAGARESYQTYQPYERYPVKWNRVATAIKSDILEGFYSADKTLPPLRHLQGCPGGRP